MRERQRDKGRLTDIVEYSDNIIELLEKWTQSEDSFIETDDSDREKNIELARKMKLDNISTELISKYTGLNADEISAL